MSSNSAEARKWGREQAKKSYIKAVHSSVLWREFYRDDRPAYEKMLKDAYGKTSSKDLSFAQLGDLLDYLNNRKKHPGNPSKKFGSSGAPAGVRKGGKITGIASPAEHRKISALRRRIRWDYADGYERWLRSRIGTNRVKTKRQAWQAIEGLKKMFENQMSAKHGSDWAGKDYDDAGIMEYIRRHK